MSLAADVFVLQPPPAPPCQLPPTRHGNCVFSCVERMVAGLRPWTVVPAVALSAPPCRPKPSRHGSSGLRDGLRPAPPEDDEAEGAPFSSHGRPFAPRQSERDGAQRRAGVPPPFVILGEAGAKRRRRPGIHASTPPMLGGGRRAGSGTPRLASAVRPSRTPLPIAAGEAWIPDTTFFASLECRSGMTRRTGSAKPSCRGFASRFGATTECALRHPPLGCRPSPPQGGRSAVPASALILQRWRSAATAERVISPPVGEMAGRPEGGATGRASKDAPGRRSSLQCYCPTPTEQPPTRPRDTGS